MMVRRTDRVQDEVIIRRLEEAYDVAWSRGDSKALVSSFASEIIVVTPRGEVTTGPEAFE